MNATKRNNLQQIIKSKLESSGVHVDIYSSNDRADLVGYDHEGKYIAIKLNDDKNMYKESKTGVRMILCTSFEQFMSLFVNKRPLSAVQDEDLFGPAL